VTATDKLLGRSSAGAGSAEEITCTAFARTLLDDADAATARTTLSVQPTASPTFTGNARVNSSDSATSLLVNGATKGVRFNTSTDGTRIEGVDNTGVGSYQPLILNGSTVTIQSNGGTSAITVGTSQTATFAGQIVGQAGAVLTGTVAGNVRQLRMQTSGSTRWEVGPGFDAESGSNVGSTFWITRWSDAGSFLGTPISIARATGNVTLENQLLVSAGSVSACSVAPSGDPNTGLYFPSADVAAWVTNGTERLRVDASGYVIISKSASGTTGPEMVLRNTASLATSNACRISFLTDSGASVGGTPNGAIDCINTGGGGASSLAFSTWNGSAIGERVRIDASGNVGIGGSPSSPCHIRANNADDGVLHVEQDGTGSASVRCDYDGTGARSWIFGTAGSGYRGGGFGGEFFLYDETATAERIRVNSTGEVIVGVTDQGAYNLQCNGTGVWGAGAYVNGSDERIKNDIAPLSSCTDVIEALRPVTFRYKESWSKDQSIQPGFIAQDLQQALAGQPYLDGVVQQGTEYLSVAYQTLIPLLVKALQESNARIAALEERING
jgi:hypothetical protein